MQRSRPPVAAGGTVRAWRACPIPCARSPLTWLTEAPRQDSNLRTRLRMRQPIYCHTCADGDSRGSLDRVGSADVRCGLASWPTSSASREASTASSSPGNLASRSSRRSETSSSRPAGRCQMTPPSRSTRQWWVSVDLDIPLSRLPQRCSPPAARVRTTRSRTGLLGGRATDLLGRRRVFLASLGLYAASSLVGGLAVSPASPQDHPTGMSLVITQADALHGRMPQRGGAGGQLRTGDTGQARAKTRHDWRVEDGIVRGCLIRRAS